MARFIQEGKVIDYLNASGVMVRYGDIVTLSKRIGVAAEDIPPGAIGSVNVAGVYETPALSTEEFVVGDMLYLDATGKATKTKGSMTTEMGWAVAPKATAATMTLVKIG